MHGIPNLAKAKSIYSCAECGATSPKWQGQCPGCGAWNTLVETVAENSTANSGRFAALAGTASVQTLSEIEAREATARRLSTLTPRERQVFDALIQGRANKEIALDLDISPRTVEIFRAKVMQKMQADSLSALVRMGLRVSDA